MLVFGIELCMSKYLTVKKPRMAQSTVTTIVFDVWKSICSKSRVITSPPFEWLDQNRRSRARVKVK